MPIEFSQISSVQFDSLPKHRTVFFFPVGPLEDHGPHLPLGLDLAVATRQCTLTAQHLEAQMPGWLGVIMPQAPLGIESNTTRIAITVRPHVLRDWLVDSCRSLVSAGFIHFVCYSGHLGPKQLTAIEEAGKLIRAGGRWGAWGRRVRGLNAMRPSLISASSALVSAKDVLKSPFWPDPMEHGGSQDTSIALAISQELVNAHYRELPQEERVSSRWARNLARRRKRLSGYWGKPSEARVEQGDKQMGETLNRVFPKMRAVWEGANPNFLFRSWYSVLPPNKSFFKAWTLLFFILLTLSAWAFLTMMDLSGIE